jgi:two-component system NarL family sensor kinase
MHHTHRDAAIGAIAGILVGVAAGVLIRGRELRRRRSEIAELSRERATLVAEVLGAEERERARVAQNLHDDALQSLLAAHQDLIEAAPGRAQVTRAHEIMGVAIDRVRDAVSALHPVILEQRGLEAALEAVCQQAENQAGFESELQVEPEAVSSSTDGLVFSIARELVTNAARHSGAKHLSVGVTAADGEIVLAVDDDGRGIQPGRRDAALAEGHVGLASVVQRLDAIGGELEVESTGGKGTRAVAHIPKA